MKVLPNPRISQSIAAASELPYIPWSHLPLTKSGTASPLCKISKASSPGIPCGALSSSECSLKVFGCCGLLAGLLASALLLDYGFVWSISSICPVVGGRVIDKYNY